MKRKDQTCKLNNVRLICFVFGSKKNAKDSKNTEMYIYSENRCITNSNNTYLNHFYFSFVIFVLYVTFSTL